MAYYFPKLAAYNFAGLTRTLSQAVVGGGFRPTINGITVSFWTCASGFGTVGLTATGGSYLSMTGQAQSPIAATNTCLTQVAFFGSGSGFSRSAGGRDFSNLATPTFNVTPGDGYNYKSTQAHIIWSINFLTGVTQVYSNDVAMHNTFNVAGPFSAFNNTNERWTITLTKGVAGATAGVGDLWILDEFIDLDFTANRRQFINANRSAVALPSDGHITTTLGRRTPVHFFRITPSGTAGTDFLTNNGSSTYSWLLAPDSPALTLDLCTTTTFVGIVVPPDPLPVPPALATYPWTLEPDWADGVTERLMWKTDVLTSQIGYEQRRRLRNAPRRQIEAGFTLIGTDRRLYDAYMEGSGSGRWIVPMWWERLLLTNNGAIGDTTLYCDTRYTEIVAGSTVMLRGATPFIYETLKVTSKTNSTITFETGLTRDWEQGATLYNTKLCLLSSSNTAAGKRKADDAYQVSLTFDTQEPNDFTGVAPTTKYIDNIPILDLFPDEANDLTTTYRRLYAEFDADTGSGQARIDLASRSFIAQQFAYYTHGKAALYAWRGLLYFLQGKLVPLYVPTYFRDVEIISPSYVAVAGGTTMRIRRGGYADYINPGTIDRTLLMVFLRNGSNFVVQVASASVVNDEEEVLEFITSLPSDVGAYSIRRMCFMALARQDQDDIEITHHTEASGVTTMTTTFLTITPGRVDTAYNAAVFNGSYVKDDSPVPAPIDAQNLDPTLVISGTNSFSVTLQNEFAAFGPSYSGG